MYYLHSDIILYLFETKNIFAICLVTSMTIWILFCWMHFYFHIPATAIEGIALYIEGNKPYKYVVLLIGIDSDTCMYRSEQRARTQLHRRVWKSQSRQKERGLRFGQRKVSAYLFRLFYPLCLILVFVIYLGEKAVPNSKSSGGALCWSWIHPWFSLFKMLDLLSLKKTNTLASQHLTSSMIQLGKASIWYSPILHLVSWRSSLKCCMDMWKKVI